MRRDFPGFRQVSQTPQNRWAPSYSSRLINHSCDPSASAKIIVINGHSKVSAAVRLMVQT